MKPEIAKGVDIIVLRELVGGLCASLYSTRTRPRSRKGTSELINADFGERQETDNKGVAWDTCIYSVPEVERITRVAAQIALAADPPLPVHSIDKANVLATSRLWRKTVTETMEREYPQLKLDHSLVDSVAMTMISNPRKLNGVLLTENLFGDMCVPPLSPLDVTSMCLANSTSLSDESSVIPGSLGLLPSASLAGAPDPKKTVTGIYEP